MHPTSKGITVGICLLACFAGMPSFAGDIALIPIFRQDAGGYGRVIAGLDDVNGSGASDVLVGAPLETVNELPLAGRVYVLDAATGAAIHALQSPNVSGGGGFGANLDAVPDVSGDGVGDFVVGAFLDLAAGEGVAGRAYIFNGETGALLSTLSSPDPKSTSFASGDVAGLEDIDGDGMGDVAVGGDGGAEGAVYVFNGTTGAHLYTLNSPNGQFAGAFGSAIAGIGDVTGDGVPDIVVGAKGEGMGDLIGSGRVYVFDGADGSLVHDIDNPTPHLSEVFGTDVDSVADLDGDDVDDILVSSPAAIVGDGSTNGLVYVFSGATGALVHTISSPEGDDANGFATSIAGANDVNADGYGDIIVGTESEMGKGAIAGAGRVHVIDGLSGLELFTLSSPNAEPGGGFGWDVAALDDINDDGLTDVAATAIDEDDGLVIAILRLGRAYAFASPSVGGGEGEGVGDGEGEGDGGGGGGCAAGAGGSAGSSPWWFVMTVAILLALRPVRRQTQIIR